MNGERFQSRDSKEKALPYCIARPPRSSSQSANAVHWKILYLTMAQRFFFLWSLLNCSSCWHPCCRDYSSTFVPLQSCRKKMGMFSALLTICDSSADLQCTREQSWLTWVLRQPQWVIYSNRTLTITVLVSQVTGWSNCGNWFWLHLKRLKLALDAVWPEGFLLTTSIIDPQYVVTP